MRCVWCVLAVVLSACSRGTPSQAPTPVSARAPSTRVATVRETRARGGEDALAIGSRPEYLAPRDESIRDDDLDALWHRQLMVPVEGMLRTSLRDDFVAKRDGKIHGALDLLATRFTPVLAADDCVIGRLSSGPIGGIIIYASDLSARFVYYYAHLQRYRTGLAVGDTIAKGTVIGYVGTTGNAPPDTPHLHFQIMKRGTGRAWWDGPAIDPLPFFVFDGVRQ